MKVKQLIQKLKKMPQNAEVGVAAHDNYEWEVSGWVSSVYHHKKQDWADQVASYHSKEFDDMFEANPDEWITFGC